MSKTLASWQVTNYTGGGTTAYVRYSFNQTFQDSDGLTHLRGNWKENYIEDTCSVSGTVVTVPTHASFPTTDDVPQNQLAGCTAVLLDENRRNPITLFSNWIISANIGEPITHTALVTRNEARQELRDRETYSASVIDAKLAAIGLTSAPLATDALEGKSKLYEAALSAIAPIVVGLNSLYIGSRRLMTAAQASAASIVDGTIGKLSDRFRGMVYRSSTLVSLFNLGVFNLTDFGGVDDGATDNTTAIQAAMNACEARGGGVVRIVPSANGTGQFFFGSTLIYNQGVVIEGDSSGQNGNVQLVYTGTGAAIVIGESLVDVCIRNLTLSYSGVVDLHAVGILLTGASPTATQRIDFNNLFIDGFETGIYVLATDGSFAWQCSYIKASRVTVHNAKYCIRINSLNSDWHIADLTTYARTDGFGIYADNCASLQLDHAQLLGGEGGGAACTLGVPNPDYGEAAIHLEGGRGNIQINNSQQEGFRNSLIVNTADIEHPITMIGSILAAPIELNADTIFDSHGNTYFDNTVRAYTANTRINTFGDAVSTLDTCLDAGTGIGGFVLSGGARLRRFGKDGFDVDANTPIRVGTLPNANDTSLLTTPVMEIGSSIVDKVLFAIGQAASSILTNHFQFSRDSAGFLAIDGTQAIPNRGLKLNMPLKFVGTSGVNVSDVTRSVADASVTNASPNISSATASFVAGDRGKIVLLSGGSTVPNGTWIKSITSSTAAVLSANVTTTGTGRTLAIYGNAVLNYDPVANLIQSSKNGAPFQNPQTSDDAYAVGAIPKQLSSSEQAASLLTETGGNIVQTSGNYSTPGVFVSTIAIGTPPLTVTSTTKVDNLNADKLDGKDWTAPGPIGAVTPDIGDFTAASVQSTMAHAANTPSSPDSGDVWNDSTRKALQVVEAGVTQSLLGVTFTSTASATVANTTTETSIIGTGVGTKTLPANFFVVGKAIRVRVRGILSVTGTPTLNIIFKFGSTTIVATGVVATAGTIANNAFEVVVDLTCRTTGATGTVIAAGVFSYDESTHAGTRLGMAVTATVTIDTTASQVVDVTATWGTASASNTISGQVTSLEVLN